MPTEFLPHLSPEGLPDFEDSFYFNQRYYDASTGRFCSVDPIKSGMNWIIYASNNPIRFIDPTGLIDIEAVDLQDRTSGRDVVRGEYQKIYFDDETQSIRAEYKEPFDGDMKFSRETTISNEGDLNSEGNAFEGSIEGELSLSEMDFYLAGEGKVARTELGEIDASKRADLKFDIETLGADGKVGFDGLIPQVSGSAYIFRGSLTFSWRITQKARIQGKIGVGAAYGLGFSAGDGGFSAKYQAWSFEGQIEVNE